MKKNSPTDMSSRVTELEKECACLRRTIDRMTTQQLRSERIDDINLHLLKETNEKLLKFHEQAQLENLSKSDFLANMSHEIRTPLNIILGMANLLAETPLTTAQSQYLSSLRITGRQLLEILNNILEFSRIEAGKTRFEPEPFSLQKIINQLEASALPLCLRKHLYFYVKHDPLLVMERVGDPLKIFQILLNLINNAVKFTQSGSITLEISEDYQEQDSIILSVADTGIGVNLEEEKIIFDRFTQGSRSQEEEYRGAGLGLAISQKLMETMGGTIIVESELNLGSTFSCKLKLPSVEPSLRRSIRLDATVILPENFPKLKILAVDDIKENLKVIKLYLQEYPIAVTTAGNGEEALKRMRLESYDIVLMDIRMPVMDGITATRKIREKEKDYPGEPDVVLAVTAHAFQEQKNKFLDAGFDGVLTKPFFKRELIQSLYKYSAKGQANPVPEEMGNKALGFCIEHEKADEIPTALREILPDLFHTISNDLEVIKNALESKDFERVHSRAHAIRGVAGMFGLYRLASLIADLSESVRATNFFVAAELLLALDTYLEYLLKPSLDTVSPEAALPASNQHRAD